MAKAQAQSYVELKAELLALQEKVQAAREAERGEVIARMREAIIDYEVEAHELGYRTGSRTASAPRVRKPQAPSKHYRDPETGNTWVGRGPRPAWVRDALAAGKKLEDFVVA